VVYVSFRNVLVYFYANNYDMVPEMWSKKTKLTTETYSSRTKWHDVIY